MGAAVQAYLDAKSEMLSHKRATVAWKAAAPFWKDMPIARVDEQTATDYGKYRKRCRAITVRNELAVIRAALNWCEKEKLLSRAPFIKMPKLPEAKVRYINKVEFRNLVNAAHAPHIALFMTLAVGTGARATALLELTWDRVNLDRKQIDLNPHDRVQTSKYRALVNINDQTRDALEQARDGALSEYVIEYGARRVLNVKKGFNAAAAKAGLKVTPHMLRHSAAVWMAESGQPMAVIAQFLGHSDSRITERVYARFSPQFLSQAAESLTW